MGYFGKPHRINRYIIPTGYFGKPYYMFYRYVIPTGYFGKSHRINRYIIPTGYFGMVLFQPIYKYVTPSGFDVVLFQQSINM